VPDLQLTSSRRGAAAVRDQGEAGSLPLPSSASQPIAECQTTLLKKDSVMRLNSHFSVFYIILYVVPNLFLQHEKWKQQEESINFSRNFSYPEISCPFAVKPILIRSLKPSLTRVGY
jgi:hypothetical protein